jgi:hypothetical protein
MRRHELDPVSLTFGFAFTGLGLLFLLDQADQALRLRWVWPLLLLALGAAILLDLARGPRHPDPGPTPDPVDSNPVPDPDLPPDPGLTPEPDPDPDPDPGRTPDPAPARDPDPGPSPDPGPDPGPAPVDKREHPS